MKKAILAIVACLYLVVTSGVQLQFHYCMGHLERTSVSVLPDAKCAVCGMVSGKSACCHTVNQWVKVGDNHQPSVAFLSLPTPFETGLLPTQDFYTKPSRILAQAPILTGNHSPPPSPVGQLHIYYCVFRV